MVAKSSLDFKMVLFPPVAIVLFLGVIGGPIGAIFFILARLMARWNFNITFPICDRAFSTRHAERRDAFPFATSRTAAR